MNTCIVLKHAVLEKLSAGYVFVLPLCEKQLDPGSLCESSVSGISKSSSRAIVITTGFSDSKCTTLCCPNCIKRLFYGVEQ